MSRNYPDLDIAITDPHQLSHGDFRQLHDFIQDMWAEWSWELIHCSNCDTISGKKDVFSSLWFSLYSEKVSTILSRLHIDTIVCPHCASHTTEFVNQPQDTIPTMRQRLLTSIESNTIICRDPTGDIVGYGEVYADTFENAYRWELSQHYGSIDVTEMKTRVYKLLGIDPSIMVVFSVLWLSLKYRSPFLFAHFLKTFSANTHFKHEEQPGLMEIWKNNGVYQVCMKLGWRSLNETDPEYFSGHLKASPHYDSVIALFPRGLSLFRKSFTKESVRGILQVA